MKTKKMLLAVVMAALLMVGIMPVGAAESELVTFSADSLDVTDNILRKCGYGKLLVNAYIATGKYREAQKLAEEIIEIRLDNGLSRDFDLESEITLFKKINPK